MSSEELYPSNNKEYATKEYWDWRYEKDAGEYDWFQGSYEKCKELLLTLVNPNDRLLQVGCGNSKLSSDIYDALAGEVDVVNVDFSEVVIENMKKQNEGRIMSWLVMDALDLQFEPASFDVVIDKGTMDAIMCEQGDVWELPADIAECCAKEMQGISRILKSGGMFIYITFGQPHFRKPVLLKEEYNWELEVKTIGDGFHYYVYILRKR